jgi:hypothetical protein
LPAAAGIELSRTAPTTHDRRAASLVADIDRLLSSNWARARVTNRSRGCGG